MGRKKTAGLYLRNGVWQVNLDAVCLVHRKNVPHGFPKPLSAQPYHHADIAMDCLLEPLDSELCATLHFLAFQPLCKRYAMLANTGGFQRVHAHAEFFCDFGLLALCPAAQARNFSVNLSSRPARFFVLLAVMNRCLLADRMRRSI